MFVCLSFILFYTVQSVLVKFSVRGVFGTTSGLVVSISLLSINFYFRKRTKYTSMLSIAIR